MAQIDLKHATIYIKDGSTNVGNAAITGATLNRAAEGGAYRIYVSMTGLVKVNQTFTITGEATTPPVHTVTGQTQSGGNTTSIFFSTPLLKDLPAGAALTVPLLATTGANILEIRIGEGNLTYTEKQNLDYRRNRGLLDTVRLGNEDPVDVSFDFLWEFLRSNTGEPVTIEEALKRKGNASGWVTTAVDPCEPYAVDIEVRNHPICANEDDELIILQDFRWETLDHNLKDGTVAVKGTCNVTRAVISRVDVDALNEPIPVSPSRQAEQQARDERIQDAKEERERAPDTKEPKAA